MDTYSVSYALNNGTLDLDNPTSYTVDNAQSLVLNNPSREYYEFLGWYHGDTKITTLVGVYQNLNLEAKWKCIFILSEGTITGITDYGKANYTEVAIPTIIDGTSVIAIGTSAFKEYKNLTSITIPDSVTSIGISAFSGCSNLESITLPFVGDSKKTASDTYQYPFGYIFGMSSYTGGIATTQYYYGSSTSSKTYSTYYIPTTLKSVTITGGNILSYAFYGCTGLTSITIGNGVESIGNRAFDDCTGLTSITIPNSVTSIGSEAFLSCSSLNAVYINDLVVWCEISFGSYSANPLYYAKELYLNGELVTNLVLPNSITGIGSYAFYGYDSLTSITIPDSVVIIGTGAFSGCTNIESATVPANAISSIPKYNLKTVVITSGTSIDREAFSNCKSLMSVTIADSVTSIGSGAFEGCTGLTSIMIPNSVTSIGSSAFSGCISLQSMTIPFVGETVKTAGDTYQYPFGYIFGTNGYTGGVPTTQRYYGSNTNSTTSTTYYIPANLKSVTITGGNILYGAFYNCSGLTRVTIGNSVTSIGSAVFSGCSSLRSITLPFVGASATTTSGSNSVLFGYIFGTSSYSGGTEIVQRYYVDEYTIEYEAFYIPSSLKSVTITGGNILYGAFYGCSGLTSVTIGDDITSIGERAFENCSSLTSVTIGNSVTNIGWQAFGGCYRLFEVINKSILEIAPDSSGYGGLGEQAIEVHSGESKIVDENGYLFYTYGGVNYLLGYVGEATQLNFPASYNGKNYEIRNHSFYNCSDLTSITIPNSVTSIGNYAFHKCTGLTSVTIDTGVTSIGDSAFYDCENLTSITIPDSVMSIGAYAFDGCTGLMSVTIGNGVTSIYPHAFFGCTGLTSITIPNSVTSIGNNAFVNCTRLTSVTIGNGVTSYLDGVFDFCTGITSIVVLEGNTKYHSNGNCLIETESKTLILGCQNSTIPDGVTRIGSSAFEDCAGLTEITIPDSVTSIGSGAFEGCTGLASIKYCGTEEQWNEIIKDGSWDYGADNYTIIYNYTGE